jgi:hypothetical protein
VEASEVKPVAKLGLGHQGLAGRVAELFFSNGLAHWGAAVTASQFITL